MKIVVVGLGYVGLSNAVLLAQQNEVIGVDISQDRVEALNNRKSPIIDSELSEYLMERDLNLSATTDLSVAVKGANYVIVSTPTHYDETTGFFDTSSVETVIKHVIKTEPSAYIVVKSTIPIGFIKDVTERLQTDAVLFSPEFLREGRALYDNLHPSRIIVGEKTERARKFAELLVKGAIKPEIDVLFTGSREAEAIKLFSNTYLAMRVAFFNELDSYALSSTMNSREIIDGISHDPRIGKHYNNPSFGYGGYCLPKDAKQLLATYDCIPQKLIKATVEANATRKEYITQKIVSYKPQTIGIYRLSMKTDSDNFRSSSTQDIMIRLSNMGQHIILYEPLMKESPMKNVQLITNLEDFKNKSDLIVCNRITHEIRDAEEKVFTRDIYNNN